MLCPDQVSTEIEQITDRCMSTQESLGLPHRLELPHPSLSDPGHLMRLLCSIVLIPLSTVDRLGDQLPMRYTIAPQFLRNYLPGIPAMVS